jgi:hypothetical protein
MAKPNKPGIIIRRSRVRVPPPASRKACNQRLCEAPTRPLGTGPTKAGVAVARGHLQSLRGPPHGSLLQLPGGDASVPRLQLSEVADRRESARLPIDLSALPHHATRSLQAHLRVTAHATSIWLHGTGPGDRALQPAAADPARRSSDPALRTAAGRRADRRADGGWNEQRGGVRRSFAASRPAPSAAAGVVESTPRWPGCASAGVRHWSAPLHRYRKEAHRVGSLEHLSRSHAPRRPIHAHCVEAPPLGRRRDV